MDQNALFRKSAIDKLSSPERLDVLMQVTSPKGWAALVMMGIVLGGGVVWGFVGTVPTRIDGQGILIRGGGLRELRADGEGTLTRLHVAPNGMVAEGSLVADLSLEDIQDRVRQARQRYDDALREYEAARGEDQATIAGTQATIRGHQAELERVRAQLANVEDDLKAKNESLAQGLITRARVQQIERERLQLQAQLTGIQSTITSLQASIRGVDQRIRSRKGAADAALMDLERMTSTATRVTQVTSTVAGRVIELKKNVGDQVRTGELLAIIEPPSATLEPIVYVDSAVGKRIQAGMEVQVSPSTVRREEYGFIKGTVLSIGDYPVTPESIMSVVANQALAQELLGGRSKLEMRVALAPDEHTPSGYAWSSAVGPPFRVESGTRLTVSVVVDRRAPITFVLPMLRDLVGLS
jgi:HlyD family secretion protein